MWRRPFRVIRDIAGPDRASTGDESTRTGGHREWRRAVLRIARPIAADLRARARTKDRESVLSLPWMGYGLPYPPTDYLVQIVSSADQRIAVAIVSDYELSYENLLSENWTRAPNDRVAEIC